MVDVTRTSLSTSVMEKPIMKSLCVFVAVFVISVEAAIATESQVIDWKDLRTSMGITDPFKKLDPQQLRELGHLVRLRRLIAEDKIPSNGDDAKEADEIEKRLRDAKVDIEWLLAQRRIVRRMREDEGRSVQTSLESKDVTLAGFVIPLKRDDELVSEFLLVPAFDFCCRVVAPPPNQTVYVRSDIGVTMKGRFAAAQITGTISAKLSKWSVQRDDRAVEFNAAYRIEPQVINVHAAKQ